MRMYERKEFGLKKYLFVVLVTAIGLSACAAPVINDTKEEDAQTAALENTADFDVEGNSGNTDEDATDANAQNLTDTEKFIEQYESYNLQSYLQNNRSKLHRSVTLNHDANIAYITYKDAIEKLNNGDSFVLYYGWPTCPYCRATVEPLLNASAEMQETIYVIELPDTDYETSRTNYEWKDGEVTVSNSNDDYEEFIDAFGGLDTFPEKVVYKDDEKTEEVKTGEPGMYAPTILLVKNKTVAMYEEDDWKDQDSDQKDSSKSETQIALENAIQSVLD